MSRLEAKDLRIGNYIFDRNDQLCKVKELSEDEINAPVIDWPVTGLPHKPIPINEEWIIKFGFEKNRDYKHPFAPIYFIEIRAEWICFLHNCTHRRIKYVHQLQNLFHSITGGEELELKETI